MNSNEDESLAWRRQVLEEATRLRAALKEAQARRLQHSKPAPKLPTNNTEMSPEMEIFEEAQASLKRNTTRLLELRRQVEADSRTEEAEQAQLAFLDMAELEMERTRQRMKELELEVSETVTEESSEPPSSAKESTTTTTVSEPEGSAHEEEETDQPTALIAMPSAAEMRHLDISLVQKVDEEQRPIKERTISMDVRDEQTWDKMMHETPPTPSTTLSPSPSLPSKGTATSDPSEFTKPKAVKKEEVTFDLICREMQLASSPLVFFNLACFQNATDAELEVMLPICGYAVAGRMLCVMGPSGTNTAILRAALSEPVQGPSQREVHVADFTVRDLVEVADRVVRPDYLAPNVSLLKHLELETVANVQIGTCIQRGAADADQTIGTPRGSRNPEMPTPRNPSTPRFRGTGAGLQKSVLLMEDLVSILDAEAIFRVLKILRKVVSAKRATVLITLSKPFERRGLFGLFDDALYFTPDGVSYFGPAKRLKDYCSLIGHACPPTAHVTDHINTISNAAAKYDESPIKGAVDLVISEFTGKPRKQPRTDDGAPEEERKGGLFKRKSKQVKKKEEDDDDDMGGGSLRQRRLAQMLAEERRQQALQQKASEKLEVWCKLSELDSHIPKSVTNKPIATSIVNFDQIILELQEEAKKHRPSCFMNLACFITPPETRETQNVVQPTVAYANEGQLLGIMGPQGMDASNLLSSLKGSDVNTMITPLTVRDTLKLSEFVKHREHEKLEHSVELVMGKMMLSACSAEVVGTLIQRGNPAVPPSTVLSIGDQTFSTAVRSILVLDHILELDAQSVFVVLKLLKRIATSARLAIILMMDRPEVAEGLFYLMDNVLVFTEEGVGYFGAARHMSSYAALVGFPCPDDKHISNHFRQVMHDNPPSAYVYSEGNIDTPFTIRYQYSALNKFNKGIIELATKPAQDGGTASARTFVPKSFRSRKTSRTEDMDAAIERAELARQNAYRMQMARDEEHDKIRQRDKAFEEVWKRLAASDTAKGVTKQPLKAGLKSIVAEMMEYQSKPSLFFNLACFLPDATTDRLDMMQPICGYALVGRIVAIVGPPETDLSSFLRALSGETPAQNEEMPLASQRHDVRHRLLTVFDLLKIAESSRTDRGNQPIVETTKALMANLGLEKFADSKIGTMIQRGVTEAQTHNVIPAILMLDKLSEALDAQSAFVILKVVKRVAAQARLSVIVHLVKQAERRGLFPLVDDVIVFDTSGVTYFGPANRLGDYLRLVGFTFDDSLHETDACFALLNKYADTNRAITDTAPPVRYKYSPIAEYIATVVTKYTKPSEKSEFDLQSSRNASDTNLAGSTFVPKNTRNLFKKKTLKLSKEEERRKAEEEEAALRREEIAAREAEAERMRIAEADAEAVWQRMAEQGGLDYE